MQTYRRLSVGPAVHICLSDCSAACSNVETALTASSLYRYAVPICSMYRYMSYLEIYSTDLSGFAPQK